MRQPTEKERAKESSLFYTNLADIAVTILVVIVAIGSGSLTMLGEAVRGVLLLSTQIYSIWVLYGVHRGRFKHYEFGVGKMEQFVWVIVGSGLLFAAIWVMQAIVETVFSTVPAATPLGLALAAVVNAINTLINAVGLYSMYSVSSDRDGGVFGAQIRARVGMLFTTLILQISLTMAAIAKDPDVALILDAAGALLIIYFKTLRGIGMISHGLPALLDAPARKDDQTSIIRIVNAVVPDINMESIRTRRCGDITFAELTVSGETFSSIAALQKASAEINHRFDQENANIELSVVVAPISAENLSHSTS